MESVVCLGIVGCVGCLGMGSVVCLGSVGCPDNVSSVLWVLQQCWLHVQMS